MAAALAVLTLAAVTAAAAWSARGRFELSTAALLGLVEGLTEFLPVSSTGHLTVVERLLGLEGSAADSFAIVIQAGAILAVLVLYQRRIGAMLDGLRGRNRIGRRLLLALIAAAAPALAVGAVFGEAIKDRLFGVGPVAAAWAVGGVAILVGARRVRERGEPLEWLGWRAGGAIGLAQVVALWPGVSRSLVTMLAGVGVGLSLPAAVEFSFLLGLVTLGAATGYEAVRAGPDLVRSYGLTAPAVGFGVAFLAAVASVRWMVRYLEHGSLAPFGWYRVGAAAVALALLATGVV